MQCFTVERGPELKRTTYNDNIRRKKRQRRERGNGARGHGKRATQDARATICDERRFNLTVTGSNVLAKGEKDGGKGEEGGELGRSHDRKKLGK